MVFLPKLVETFCSWGSAQIPVHCHTLHIWTPKLQRCLIMNVFVDMEGPYYLCFHTQEIAQRDKYCQNMKIFLKVVPPYTFLLTKHW